MPQLFRPMPFRPAATALAVVALTAAMSPAAAQTVNGVVNFVNGLALSGSTADLSGGSSVDSRVGFFSDIYYDANRNEWWGLSDRGPGGGLLSYGTRVQRFTLEINATTGAISNFQVVQTLQFGMGGSALNGRAPSPTSSLGNAFDPEGIVVNPRNGNLLVSDEYGPSLYEIDRNTGQMLRAFTTPANLVPRNATTGVANYSDDTGNNAGKRGNRGFEGLAISPDGRYAYAMLQSPTLDEGGSNGYFTRIVKFDTDSGQAVGQYAYKMERNNQGQGISSLVALGNDKFLVLERNNRGIGVGATLAGADKAVFEIDLAGATDISNVALTNSNTTTLPAGVVAVTKKINAVIDLDANTLAELGGKSPEKWEGLAVGPQLSNGRYVVIAGTDNDYSVTQNGSGTQFDVYMRMTDADPYASAIQCPIGQTVGCTSALTAEYKLLPGVLHAYSAQIDGYLMPVPEGDGLLMALAGGGLLAGLRRRRAVA